MNKTQSIFVAVSILAIVSYIFPMLLADAEIWFDLPPFGHISLFDPASLFGSGSLIFLGGLLSILVMGVMLTEIRRRNKH